RYARSTNRVLFSTNGDRPGPEKRGAAHIVRAPLRLNLTRLRVGCVGSVGVAVGHAAHAPGSAVGIDVDLHEVHRVHHVGAARDGDMTGGAVGGIDPGFAGCALAPGQGIVARQVVVPLGGELKGAAAGVDAHRKRAGTGDMDGRSLLDRAVAAFDPEVQ